MIKDQQEITEIVIYKKNEQDRFQIEKQCQFDQFSDACIQFSFAASDSNQLLFFTAREVFRFDYTKAAEGRIKVYELENELEDQPKFGVFNADQTRFIVTSAMDILYVDMNIGFELDIDDQEEISSIQNIIADDLNFYILANKKEGKLGYYLLRISIENPEDPCEYLIRWSNKLDIANCDMHILEEKDPIGKVSKSIVVSYKCIGINTFNVFVIDLHTKLIKYWHEGY